VIADLHLDALLDVLERRELGDDDAFAQRHLPMLEAAGVRVQVLPAFVDDRHLPESALRVTIQQLDAARREADRSDGRLRIVEGTLELREAIADGAIAGILSLEGVEALGRDPGMIRTLHRLGVRMAGLTWNRANAFADGLAEQTGAGITGLGVELLDEMAQLGMALDLSHLSPRGCELALERYGGPVLASHANAAAVFANPRNLGDDVLAGVGERGGVVGLCAIPAFVGPGDPAQRLAEHLQQLRPSCPRALEVQETLRSLDPTQQTFADIEARQADTGEPRMAAHFGVARCDTIRVSRIHPTPVRMPSGCASRGSDTGSARPARAAAARIPRAGGGRAARRGTGAARGRARRRARAAGTSRRRPSRARAGPPRPREPRALRPRSAAAGP